MLNLRMFICELSQAKLVHAMLDFWVLPCDRNVLSRQVKTCQRD